MAEPQWWLQNEIGDEAERAWKMGFYTVSTQDHTARTCICHANPGKHRASQAENHLYTPMCAFECVCGGACSHACTFFHSTLNCRNRCLLLLPCSVSLNTSKNQNFTVGHKGLLTSSHTHTKNQFPWLETKLTIATIVRITPRLVVRNNCHPDIYPFHHLHVSYSGRFTEYIFDKQFV